MREWVKGYFKLLLLVPITQFSLSVTCAQSSLHRRHILQWNILVSQKTEYNAFKLEIDNICFLLFMPILFFFFYLDVRLSFYHTLMNITRFFPKLFIHLVKKTSRKTPFINWSICCLGSFDFIIYNCKGNNTHVLMHRTMVL